MSSAFWVKVKNWDKHNPRKDIKEPKWFAFSNRLIEDPDFYDFSHGEFKTLIYIFSQASQKRSSVVYIQPQHADRVCNIENADLLSACSKLQSLGIIDLNPSDTEIEHARSGSVREPIANVQIQTATGQRRTGQDRTEQGRTEDPNESGSAPAAVLESESEEPRTKLEKVADPELRSVLKHVTPYTQEYWLSRWGEAKPIAEVLKTCLMKRSIKKLNQAPSEWEYILTSWLCNEKPQSFKNAPRLPKPNETLDDPHCGGEEAYRDLLGRLKVKSITDLIKQKRGASHAN